MGVNGDRSTLGGLNHLSLFPTTTYLAVVIPGLDPGDPANLTTKS